MESKLTDQYTSYMQYCNQLYEPDFDVLVDDPSTNRLRPMSIEEFATMNDTFRAKWESSYLLGEMKDERIYQWTNLTHEQALFIKNLRVVEGHSWRSVARNFTAHYNAQGPATQMMGAILCDTARKMLNESHEQWN